MNDNSSPLCSLCMYVSAWEIVVQWSCSGGWNGNLAHENRGEAWLCPVAGTGGDTIPMLGAGWHKQRAVPARQLPDGHTPAMICAHTTDSVSYAPKHRCTSVFIHRWFHVICAHNTPLIAKLIAYLKVGSSQMCTFCHRITCAVYLTAVFAQYKVYKLKARALWIMTNIQDVPPDTWKSTGTWHFQVYIDVVAKQLLNRGDNTRRPWNRSD